MELINTTFAMPLREAMTLMQSADLLIGMHGAGMPHRNYLSARMHVPKQCSAEAVHQAWRMDAGQNTD